MWLLMTLKYRGNVEKLADDYARNKIISLQQESKRRFGTYPDYRYKGRKRWVDGNDKFNISTAEAFVFGSIIIIFLTGLVTIIYWILVMIMGFSR